MIPSPSLAWNLKRMVSRRNLLFEGAIFRFHVKISEGYQCLHIRRPNFTWFPSKNLHVPVDQGENRGAEFGSTFTYPNQIISEKSYRLHVQKASIDILCIYSI